MFEHTYNRERKTKKGAIGAFNEIFNKYYFLLVKKDAIRINTTNPTKPPLPNPFTNEVRLAITSIPNTYPPVKTNQRIDTGIKAINNAPNPPKNPLTIENTFSIFLMPVTRTFFN